MIRKKYPTDGSEIVLLTDGEDTSISTCFPEVKQSRAIIHTVALGPDAAKELEELSKMTGEGQSAEPHSIVPSTGLRAPVNWGRGERGEREKKGHFTGQVTDLSPNNH